MEGSRGGKAHKHTLLLGFPRLFVACFGPLYRALDSWFRPSGILEWKLSHVVVIQVTGAYDSSGMESHRVGILLTYLHPVILPDALKF